MKILEEAPFLLQGVAITLQVTAIAVFLGIVLGALLCLLRLSKAWPLRVFAQGYVSLFRGVPLILQLMLVYFGASGAFGITFSPFEASVMVFSLNSAAYVSEIFRAGINSIDIGQTEAADGLGLSYRQRMVYIIIPQAIQRVLPALINEIIDLLKESAIVSTIGVMDLMRRASLVASRTYKYFETYILVALIYYIMVLLLARLARMIEYRLNKSHGVEE